MEFLHNDSSLLPPPSINIVQTETTSTVTTVAFKERSTSRLLSLDLLRGLIIIVMAWDHSHDFISDGKLPKDHGDEGWSGPLATYDNNVGLFLQRWLTHFCAPGFFWLMGIGMAFFSTSRSKRGWSNWQIIKHFQIRGLFLVFSDRLVNIPAYVQLYRKTTWLYPAVFPTPNALLGLLSIFEVLTSLGLTMMICGLLLPTIQYLSKKIKIFVLQGGQILCMLLGGASFVISNIVVIHYQDGDPTKMEPFPRSADPAKTFPQYLVRDHSHRSPERKCHMGHTSHD
ncbi:unnamed protein product [Didymodactylos carnosus]|uniref:Heparan-alpha-glucosaminide N-acetyltransferase catalytic domain-containing protein n=1 Tax=Didymodactylos carnosus TaxID=1234261 RepID=A0A814PZ33_9BILA|nr:unnamed protein product [Didymodactylos carnosus]CAF3876673.1 unnamed protein product [Didymodactylos carnosus]